jgi:hypothetical protein
MPDGRLIALIVLIVGLLAVGGYFWWDHLKHGREPARGARRPAERLPLFGTDLLVARGADGDDGASGARRTPPTVRAVPRADWAGSGMLDTQPVGRPVQPGASPISPFAPPAGGQLPVSAPALAATDTHRAVVSVAAARGAAPLASPGQNGGRHAAYDGPLHEGETLRFAIPDEGTLQFLPGRLEVMAGPDAGREIRFVRTPGPERPAITFGRSEGPAYTHVQLLARTVSRRHAQMTLVDEHWTLQNLSSTNPVTLNGRPLAPNEVAPLLVDGDRIEMGEVVFQFHGR